MIRKKSPKNSARVAFSLLAPITDIKITLANHQQISDTSNHNLESNHQIHTNTYMNQSLSQQSRILTQWHFVIACFFEGSKYLHQIGLCALLPSPHYGLVGTLFSLAYLSANFCTLEVGTAVLSCITEHKTKNLYHSLIKTILWRPLVQHAIGSLCVIAYAHHYTSLSLACLAGCSAFTEGMRITLRPLVYASSPSTRIAQGEAALSFIYIALIWTKIALSQNPISILVLIAWYACISAFGLGYLCLKGLPQLTRYKKSVAHLPRTRIHGLLRTQGSLILLHMPHHLFSANFLVPFFAHNTSLQCAGILKITSELASALKSILKSSISFPLHTLMLTYTEHTKDIRKNFTQAMTVIIPKATRGLSAFIAIGCLCAGGVSLYGQSWLREGIILFMGFCILTCADYLCMPYELLSLYRKKISTAAVIRGVEMISNAAIILIYKQNPLSVICIIASIRFLTWRVLAYESESAPPSFLQD
jgi:hypothetical protein